MHHKNNGFFHLLKCFLTTHVSLLSFGHANNDLSSSSVTLLQRCNSSQEEVQIGHQRLQFVNRLTPCPKSFPTINLVDLVART